MNILQIIPILLTLGTQPQCDGFGICLVEPETENAASECQKYENCIQAEMSYEDHNLFLIVSQVKINDKAFIKYFTKEDFELDQDFVLPDEVTRNLDCPQGLTIEKGKYPINEENGKIVVRFKI